MNKTSEIYFIGDTHFSHKLMIELGYRKFNNIEEMNEDLIIQWNSVVSKKSNVFHLGDFGFGSVAKNIKILNRLNGHIHLIKGNHDTWLNVEAKNRFVWVKDYVEIKDPTKTVKKIILFHYPIEYWRHREKGSLHIHGHVHVSDNRELFSIKNRINVNVDIIGYTPISLENILKQIEV